MPRCLGWRRLLLRAPGGRGSAVRAAMPAGCPAAQRSSSGPTTKVRAGMGRAGYRGVNCAAGRFPPGFHPRPTLNDAHEAGLAMGLSGAPPLRAAGARIPPIRTPPRFPAHRIQDLPHPLRRCRLPDGRRPAPPLLPAVLPHTGGLRGGMTGGWGGVEGMFVPLRPAGLQG